MATTTTAASHLLFLSLFLSLAINWPTTTGIGICDVVLPLTPCLAAFANPSGKPSTMCCTGAAIVQTELRAPGGRQVVCQCLKTLIDPLPLVSPGAARNVLEKCNVLLPVPDLDTDCLTDKNNEN